MIGVVDNGSRYFKDILKILNKLNVKYEILKMENLTKINIDKFQGLILSGSPLMLADSKVQWKIKRCYKFLKSYEKPLLGICFGLQIIGFMNDVKLKNLGFCVKGMQKILIQKKDKIFNGLSSNLRMDFNHEEYLVKVPKDSELLASSNFVDVVVIKHKKFNQYGVQFHPETSGKDGEKFIKNFLKVVV